MKYLLLAGLEKAAFLFNLLNSAKIQSGVDLTAYFSLLKNSEGGGAATC